VCVWDDLVDVPVVVPLRAASPDTRRRHQGLAASLPEERDEEMDISAAHASAPPPQHDLLGVSSPAQENRFNVSRQSSQLDVGADNRDEDLDLLDSDPLSPDSVQDFVSTSNTTKGPRTSGSYFPPRRPNSYTHRPRMSYEEPRASSSRHHHRRFSLGGSGARGRDRRNSNPFLDEGDEGDLGYTAAGDREGNRKKVIVERLETVKGGTPFFTWC
jgi:phosphatidylinositol 4-kinase type 2